MYTQHVCSCRSELTQQKTTTCRKCSRWYCSQQDSEFICSTGSGWDKSTQTEWFTVSLKLAVIHLVSWSNRVTVGYRYRKGKTLHVLTWLINNIKNKYTTTNLLAANQSPYSWPIWSRKYISYERERKGNSSQVNEQGRSFTLSCKGSRGTNGGLICIMHSFCS